MVIPGACHLPHSNLLLRRAVSDACDGERTPGCALEEKYIKASSPSREASSHRTPQTHSRGPDLGAGLPQPLSEPPSCGLAGLAGPQTNRGGNRSPQPGSAPRRAPCLSGPAPCISRWSPGCFVRPPGGHSGRQGGAPAATGSRSPQGVVRRSPSDGCALSKSPRPQGSGSPLPARATFSSVLRPGPSRLLVGQVAGRSRIVCRNLDRLEWACI